MKFEEVLPAYRAGKTIIVTDEAGPISFNPNNKGSNLLMEYILKDTWSIEPDKCSHCDGTGKEKEPKPKSRGDLCEKICQCGSGHRCNRPFNHGLDRNGNNYCNCNTLISN